jgi:Txe/YoeB family toxin of Txe-Axe toxin-antitoxin module
MSRKTKISYTPSQNLEYAKLMTEENYSNKNIMNLINNISIDTGNTIGKRRIHGEFIELGHALSG